MSYDNNIIHFIIHTYRTLQRHSRATFSKAIPVSPISARSCVDEELLPTLLLFGANAADVARADSRMAA